MGSVQYPHFIFAFFRPIKCRLMLQNILRLCQTLCFLFPCFMSQVEDALNRATDNPNVARESDILSFRAQLGPLTTVSIFNHDLHLMLLMIGIRSI